MFTPSASPSLSYLKQPFYTSYLDDTIVAGPFATDNFYVAFQKLEKVQFGIALESNSPDGVLGLGYASYQAQVLRHTGHQYDTLLDHLQKKHLIKTKAYSLWLSDQTKGQIIFGGIDRAKFKGRLTALPVQQVQGDYRELKVRLNSIRLLSHGKQQVKFSSSKYPLPRDVLLDIGASRTHLPRSITIRIRKMLGVKTKSIDELGIVDCSLAQSKAKLHFEFGSKNSRFFTIPISMPQLVRPNGNKCELSIVGTLENRIIIGHNVLSSIYMLYDLDNNQISFAPLNKGATRSHVVEIAANNEQPEDGVESEDLISDESQSPTEGNVEGESSIDLSSLGSSEDVDADTGLESLPETEDIISADKSSIASEQNPVDLNTSIYSHQPQLMALQKWEIPRTWQTLVLCRKIIVSS